MSELLLAWVFACTANTTEWRTYKECDRQVNIFAYAVQYDYDNDFDKFPYRTQLDHFCADFPEACDSLTRLEALINSSK